MKRFTTFDEFAAVYPHMNAELVNKNEFAEHCGSAFCDDDEADDNEVYHPVLKRMLNGEAPIDVDMEDHWRDDHEFCVLLKLTYPDKVYLISYWWVSATILLPFGKMIGNGDRARQFVLDFYDPASIEEIKNS